MASEVMGVIMQAEGAKLSHMDEADMSAEQLVLKGSMSLFDVSERSFITSFHYTALAIEKDQSLTFAFVKVLMLVTGARALRYKKCETYMAKIPKWIAASKPLVYENPTLGLLIALIEYQSDFEKSKLRPQIEHALVRGPFDMETLLFSGWAYLWMGDPLPALECFAKFRKLGRLSSDRVVGFAGAANASVQAGRLEEALTFVSQAYQLAPNYVFVHTTNAAALALLGRKEEAASAMKNVLRLVPGATLEKTRASSNYGGTPEGERYLEGLRLAGLPE
ncbi:MAG: tetratricopeptide repeat protein [Tateyamaria sp.]|nr:tetratricopeptide repeat protein [Tateyamaria sp.]